jgi:hypothetical protein
MRMAAACPPLLIAASLLASCERSAIDPSQSLVGANKLPSAKVLSREIIYISRGFGDWGRSHPGRLSYELRPDDTLTITLTQQDWKTIKDVVQGKETFHLPPRVAARARRDLWRLRPEPFRGIEWDTKPVGCRSDSLHDFPEVAVGFIAEGPKPGIEDDRVGVFALPYRSSCNTKQAVEARQIVREVIQSFPQSKVAAEFDRRMSVLEAKLRS